MAPLESGRKSPCGGRVEAGGATGVWANRALRQWQRRWVMTAAQLASERIEPAPLAAKVAAVTVVAAEGGW